MARATSEKVGRGLCPNAHCGEPVTYRRSAGGMLCHRCEACDSTGYAEPGGSAYKARMATIKGAAPAPSPAPAPVPGTTKKPVNSAFALSDL